MKIDNFDLMKILFPCGEDEFYFLQVIVRGKDNGGKNRLVKFYTIRSYEQLLQVKDEVISLCEVNGARAYIHPTKRNFKDVAGVFLELVGHTYVSQNWTGMKGLYSTACGKSFVNRDKKFIVDLDNIKIGDDTFKEIESFINGLRGKGEDKTFMAVPTKNGCHLVTYPFDLGEFHKRYPNIDVHKNNPTLVYV